MGERSLFASIVAVAAALVTAGVSAAANPAPDPAPTPSPDPAPVVHAKPKPVVTHVVTTAPPPATPAPTPVVVAPPAPAPVVHTAPVKKTPVHRRVRAVKPRPKHVAVRSRPAAPTTTPVVVSSSDQSAGRVTAGARVQSFTSQWKRLLSWLLLVGSLIVLAFAALPTMIPGATLVVEGRLQLALFGAALAAGGVSLLIVSGA